MSSKKLKTGFSTGTAATAAAMAALETLITGKAPSAVDVRLPEHGGVLTIKINRAGIVDNSQAYAEVIKDAGDDPDVTNKARIMALAANLGRAKGVRVGGGSGVGRVTKPGLPTPVGKAAINPVPMMMIKSGLRSVWKKLGQTDKPLGLKVTISVKDGEELAKKTLNPRLGIIGGISILGTTGLVKPYSHEAYTATIQSGLSVAKAGRVSRVVFTTGGKSEKKARVRFPELPETAFIQIADYFAYALTEAVKQEFKDVIIVSFFGKAIKQAQGVPCTHAHKARLDLFKLAEWFRSEGAPSGLVKSTQSANTARQVLSLLKAEGRTELVAGVGRRMIESVQALTDNRLGVTVNILDYNGMLLFEGKAG